MGSKILFVPIEKPTLESGLYRFAATQTIGFENPATHTAERPDPYESEMWLQVSGERFSLDPSAVHAMYPPSGSVGDYARVLPHIVIKRSTFPWERSAYKAAEGSLPRDGSACARGGDTLPWVSLLLFDEEEIARGDVIEKTISLKELMTPSGEVTFEPSELECGQDPADKVRVIDARWKLLKDVVPLGKDLRFLAHVRLEDGDTSGVAVVVCNRLPRDNSGSRAYLVSLEGRYAGGSLECAFDSQSAGDTDFVRLVSLRSWRFATLAHSKGPTAEGLDSLSIATAPSDADPSVRKYLAQGYALLPHHMRNGDFTYSWYHGPLATQEVPREFADGGTRLPASADELLRYYSDTGLFDVAYAAAFELGRVLALDSPSFAATLYRWKHQRTTRLLKSGEQAPNAGSALVVDIEEACGYQFDSSSCETLKSLHPEKANRIEKLCEALGSNTEVSTRNKFIEGVQTVCEEVGLGALVSEIVDHSSESGRRDDHTKVVLRDWLARIARLEGVPFNYLIPDERFLPSNTIRFFMVDPHWMESLFLGAFSIGRPLRSEARPEATMESTFRWLIASLLGERSGLVVRSSVVSDYPDLKVECYRDKGFTEPLAPLRIERLSPEVLFCLFEGKVGGTRLLVGPKGTHYGIDASPLLKTVDDGLLTVTVDDSNRTIGIDVEPNEGPTYDKLWGEEASARFAQLMVGEPRDRQFVVGEG